MARRCYRPCGARLQGCVDLAVLLVETTIGIQRLSTGERGVGGQVEVVTITPFEGVQKVRVFDVVSVARSRGIEVARLQESPEGE